MNQYRNVPFDAVPGEACTNFNGASIINESGDEIPITEQMLQQTFRSLIEAWEKTLQARQTK